MQPRITPKDFFLWLGAMVSLYASVIAFLNLTFEYVNRAFPDALNTYVDPYSSSMRFAIATLVVAAPLFLVLMRLIRNDIAALPEKGELWVRRWALYLTLFIAGATIAGDLVALVNTYLNGDVTVRFFLKVLLIFLVAGAGFLHFLADLRGYWQKNPSSARMVQWGVAVLIVLTIVSGFFIIGTPGQVRLYRFDDQKVSDLQSIQWQVVNYWQAKQKLPAALPALTDSIGGYTVPTDPQTGDMYTYTVKGATSFELCATFNAETQSSSYARPLYPEKGDLASESWQHDAGETCFERTIDPERYPPLKN